MAKTLIERFGFADPDRKTPLHDQICLWVHQNAAHVMQQALGANSKGVQEKMEAECKKIIAIGDALGEPIDAKLDHFDPSVAWEVPIGGKVPAGFIDLVLRNRAVIATGVAEPIWLTGCGDGWNAAYETFDHCQLNGIDLKKIEWHGFESIVQRLSRLRNAKLYDLPDCIEPEHRLAVGPWLGVEVKSRIDSIGELLRQIQFYRRFDRGPWCVVSPDTRYAGLLKDQGIAFVPYPAELVTGRNQFELF
jgi:hypothetical protein